VLPGAAVGRGTDAVLGVTDGFVELSAVGEDTNPLLLDFGKLFLE